MRSPRFFPSVCILLAVALPAGAAELADSVVKVIASLSYPNPLQPWAKGKSVVEENGIAPTRRGTEEVLKVWKRRAAPK